MKTISETKNFRSFGWIVVSVMLGLTVISRLFNHFYSITATDIAFGAWISETIGYVLDGLACLRYVFSFGALLYAQRKWGMGAGNAIFLIANVCNLTDMGVRFVIDFVSNSIVGMKMLTLMWLLLQFAYDMITLALCWITGRIFLQRLGTSDSVRRTRKYSISRAFRFSLLYVLILRVGLWFLDVIDFVGSYSKIQVSEYAAMAGQLVTVLVLYGGIAFLFSELTQWFFSRVYGKAEE